MGNFGKKELLLALAICVVTGAIILYKIFALDYSMTLIRPEDGYYVQLIVNVAGNGKPFSMRVTLPIQSERQTIKYEKQASDGAFKHTISLDRIGQWRSENLSGSSTVNYTFFAHTYRRAYPLPEGQDIPTTYSKKMDEYLAPTAQIQSDAAEIQAKARELAPDGADITGALKAIYNYCYGEVAFKNVSGPTDAVTALKLQEASCNGKNRLMVALLRARGIPARMTNGLILENRRKRATHAWTEAWVGGVWVPFCPTNGHYAEIPENYLELAKGDVPVFSHTAHVGFDWKWVIQHQMSHRQQAVFSNANNPMNILNAWTSLKDYHVSLDLIIVILMIPVGATVVAFSRNVIGVLPFGTFMPALIAVSFRDTGFILGAALFTAVIVIGTLTNSILMRLRLLHVPRLVIIITVVVMSLLGLSILCIQHGLAKGAAVSLFPMAILSLTCERFTQTLMEDGWKDAAARLVVTFFVSSACFYVMNIETLQVLIAAFPELLLCNIAINLALGSWTGMRLMEYYRFRDFFLRRS